MLQSASEIFSTTWSAVEVSDSDLDRAEHDLGFDLGHSCLGVRVLRHPCMVFNNATSLPLLLFSSLGKNGTLSPLIKGDELEEVLDRGQVYLLINALVGNLTRFSLGPRMMNSHPLDVPHPWSHSESPHAVKKVKEVLNGGYPAIEPYHDDDENAPLLDQARERGKKGWKILVILKNSLAGFMNPPMYGGLAAILAGVIPFLHSWLFDKGAWLSPVVYGVRKALGDRILSDPILIVEMSDTDEDVETAVAKTIVVSYALTPLISVSVTAALQVVEKLY
ncbi:uncharacterized protein I303_103672 [Kwoniella dejecticola CBS 10117]|uniref:Uncharacterized protein n=1 Tax=Kwoniella dejecticola CBS 10117 TaxID=1296121 RepID=A0AAJ8KN30_9TREE